MSADGLDPRALEAAAQAIDPMAFCPSEEWPAPGHPDLRVRLQRRARGLAGAAVAAYLDVIEREFLTGFPVAPEREDAPDER